MKKFIQFFYEREAAGSSLSVCPSENELMKRDCPLSSFLPPKSKVR